MKIVKLRLLQECTCRRSNRYISTSSTLRAESSQFRSPKDTRPYDGNRTLDLFLKAVGTQSSLEAAKRNAERAQATNSEPRSPDSALRSLPLETSSIKRAAAAPPSEHPLLKFFSRMIMRDGKLLTAQKHTTTMLNHIRLLTSDDPLLLFRQAVSKVSPSVRIVQQKLTATKRVPLPLPLTERQRLHKGIKAIVNASDRRINAETSFGKRLALEVLSVLDNSSEAIRKKEETHKTAMIARYVSLHHLPSTMNNWA